MTISIRIPRPLALAAAFLLCLAGLQATAAEEEIAAVTSFSHRFHHPGKPSGQTIILLHGSGGSETSLVSMAAKAAPDALLIGVGGRVIQDGKTRWYRRLTPIAFDQADIRKEAAAFATFLEALTETYRLDPARTTLLGYSNGANLIAAMALLHPDTVRRAILMRPMPVLDNAPAVDLARASFLTIAGMSDTIYAPFAPALETILRTTGAAVDARMIAASHMLGDEDVAIVSRWLASGGTVAGLQ